MKYKMPSADASQFTRLKRALAVQKADNRDDGKSVNRMTQFVPRLSGANNRALNGGRNAFLYSVTLKKAAPRLELLLNVDFPRKKMGVEQNCS